MIQIENQVNCVDITQHLASDVCSDAAVGEAAQPFSAPLRYVNSLKSALRKDSSIRRKLNVQWAPDVVDPSPTLVSHTKGHKSPKPALVSRRAKSRSQNGKGGRHKKGKGSTDKEKSKLKVPPILAPAAAIAPDVPLDGVSEAVAETEVVSVADSADADVEPTPGREGCNVVEVEVSFEGQAALSDNSNMDGAPVHALSDNSNANGMMSEASKPTEVSTHCTHLAVAPLHEKTSTEFADVAPSTSDANHCTSEEKCCDAESGGASVNALPAELQLPEPCNDPVKSVNTAKSGKKRPKRGSSKSAALKKVDGCTQVDGQDESGPLEEISKKRIAGATALASGDFDLARELLLGALVQGRIAKAHTEQARCLRLLADTQAEKQRERSLSSAVDCFASTTLAFEHAEALLCLAQHKASSVLGQMSLQWNSWKWLQAPSVSALQPGVSQDLQAAKLHLESAASLLLKNHLATPALAGPISSLNIDSPTGRRRKGKPQQAYPAEITAATVVMGSICEVWGKICILQGEFDEARAQLFAASKNSLWCQDCPDEALHVSELLEALFGERYVAGRMPQVCTVY